MPTVALVTNACAASSRRTCLKSLLKKHEVQTHVCVHCADRTVEITVFKALLCPGRLQENEPLISVTLAKKRSFKKSSLKITCEFRVKLLLGECCFILLSGTVV